MANLIIVLLAFAFGATLAAPASSPTEAQQRVLDRLQNGTEFTTIGQIGNKIFIANTKLSNGMAGRELCPNAGLEYATFKDWSEFTFINSNTNKELWLSGFLRGADDFRSDAFNWVTDGGSIPEGIGFHFYSEHWVCLYFSYGHTYTDLCLRGQHETLCQMQLG